MTSNKMIELMKKKIINKTEEYAVTHENINQNEPDDNNENKLDEKTVAYVSDIIVSTKESKYR